MSGSKPDNKIAAYIAAGKILAMIAQFAMPVFLTHYLSTENYGIYNKFYTAFLTFGIIAGFGFQSNLYYFFPHSKKEERGSLVWNNLIVMSLLGFLGSLFFVIPQLRHVILGDGPIDSYWQIIALCIALYVPTNLTNTLAVVNKDKKLACFYPPADMIAKIAIIIPTALIFNTMSAILWGVTALQLMEWIFIWCYVKKGFGRAKWKDTINLPLLKQQLQYALPFGGAVLLNTICQRFDKIICISYLSASEYAIYSLAFFGIPGIMQVYDAIVQVNVTNMASAQAENDRPLLLSLYNKFIVKVLSFSLPIIAIVFLFAPQFIEFVFSTKYAASIPYFRIYILTFIIAMFGCGTILRAIGKTGLSFRAYLLSSVIYVPLCIFLIRHYGIQGAIISAVIGICSPRLFQMFFEKKALGCSFLTLIPCKDISKIAAISIGLLIPAIFLDYFIHLNFWFAGGITVIYLLCVYIIEIRQNIFILEKETVINRFSRLRKFF